MNENERSPGWLLPIIVVILIASVILLFVASRPTSDDLPSAAGVVGLDEGPRFRLGQVSSPTDPVDPCSLVDEDELEAIVERQLGEPQSMDLDNPIGERLCAFSAAGNPDEQVVVVDMVFQEGMEPIMTQNNYDVIELYRGRKVQDRGIEDVAGIDDEAFWGGAGAEIWNGLHVRAADVYLRVMIGQGEDQEALEAAQEVVVMVLRNLFE